LLEFYQENQRLNGEKHLNPPFPVLIYNGDTKWNAPTSLRELFYKSSVPKKYIPDFSYFKIAINEIPKRELVKIRNAVSAIFYVENSTPEDIKRNRTELVSLLSSVIKDEGARIVDAIFERMRKTQKIDKKVTIIKSVEDLVEVTGMWETAVKRHEKKILEKGIEKGIERGIEEGIEKGIEKNKKENALKLIEKGMDNSFIHEITGLSLKEIRTLRKEKKKG
jgi:predicted transposase/invertase (TIGR01784 family)